MSIIQAEDLAFVRFRAPDLGAMEEFLHDFGMTRVSRNAEMLYMRGWGPEPFVHVTVKGDAGFDGLAFRAHEDDLERLARAAGRKIEGLDAPGGGKVLRGAFTLSRSSSPMRSASSPSSWSARP